MQGKTLQKPRENLNNGSFALLREFSRRQIVKTARFPPPQKPFWLFLMVGFRWIHYHLVYEAFSAFRKLELVLARSLFGQ